MFNFKDGSLEELLKSRYAFERLMESLDKQKIQGLRWFRRKNLEIAKLGLKEFFVLKPALRQREPFAMGFMEVVFRDKTSELYFLPLAFVKKGEDGLGQVATRDGVFLAIDAVNFEPFQRFLCSCFDSKAIIKGEAGSIVFESIYANGLPDCESIHTNSTNSLLRLGFSSILKLIRKIQEGINIEFEIGQFLTKNEFKYSPPLEGGINYVLEGGGASTIGIKFRELKNQGDAWNYALSKLEGYWALKEGSDPASYLKPQLFEITALAQVLAELHSCLRKDKEHPRFKPEEFTLADLEKWRESFLNLAKRSIDDAHKYVLDHPKESDRFKKISLSVDVIDKAFENLRKFEGKMGEKTRIHNDFHLQQVLKTDQGWAIIDFEGEPLRSIEERAGKASPLKDVAGMLRSIHYASYASIFNLKEKKNIKSLEKYASIGTDIVSRHFLREYIEAVRKLRCSSVPYSNMDCVKKLLALYKLEKAFYELCYELNNRPLWVSIPVAGIEVCLAELNVS